MSEVYKKEARLLREASCCHLEETGQQRVLSCFGQPVPMSQPSQQGLPNSSTEIQPNPTQPRQNHKSLNFNEHISWIFFFFLFSHLSKSIRENNLKRVLGKTVLSSSCSNSATNFWLKFSEDKCVL